MINVYYTQEKKRLWFLESLFTFLEKLYWLIANAKKCLQSKLDEKSSESDVFKELYCVKSVQIRNFFWSIFSRILENAEKTLDTFYALGIVIDVLKQF